MILMKPFLYTIKDNIIYFIYQAIPFIENKQLFYLHGKYCAFGFYKQK